MHLVPQVLKISKSFGIVSFVFRTKSQFSKCNQSIQLYLAMHHASSYLTSIHQAFVSCPIIYMYLGSTNTTFDQACANVIKW